MWQKIVLFTFALFLTFLPSKGQEDVEFFQEYFALNQKHEYLSQFIGKWKVNIVYYGTNQEEYVTGELNSSLILSFRILEMNFNLTNPTGLPFEMKYFFGYDGISKKFFLIILNSLTNDVQILKGDYQKKSNEFIFKGTTVDTKAQKRIPLIMRIFFERERKFVIESFVEEKGKERMISKFVIIKKSEE